MADRDLDREALVKDGLEYLDGCLEELLALTTEIAEIPAPSNDESLRGAFVQETMLEYGFPTVKMDAVGNVLGFLPGKDPSRIIVSMAHLDTVFPRGTDLTVRREGNILKAPGVSDNSASIAQMLLLGRVFVRHLPLRHPILLIANVGEEGLGDLRGARHFCEHVGEYEFDGFKLEPDNLVFFNIDGGSGHLTVAGVGSRRLRIRFEGQGGHSYGSFGNSSAIHGLGTAIAGIAKIQVPKDPKTTYNVGVISGGHSVNSIAQSAEMLLDLRSVDGSLLAGLEEQVRAILDTAAKETNTTYVLEVVGDRPTGSIPIESPLVQGLLAVGRDHGYELKCGAGSTDSNIPLSKGWPAVTIGFKSSEDAHKVSEYLMIDSLVPGIKFGFQCYVALLYDIG
ncbi:MAG: M20/M25/M40 family metallo-hydrolase [Bacillota bacterium]|jgi:tripeptide aminopeptidase